MSKTARELYDDYIKTEWAALFRKDGRRGPRAEGGRQPLRAHPVGGEPC